MKSSTFALERYDADEGKVFDWKEPRYIEVAVLGSTEVELVQEHLYARTLFLSAPDTIDNYIEIDAPVNQE